MKVGRASAGCKPARFGVRVNADATSIGMGREPPNRLVFARRAARPLFPDRLLGDGDPGVPLISGTLTLASLTLWVFLAAHPLNVAVWIDVFLAALPP